MAGDEPSSDGPVRVARQDEVPAGSATLVEVGGRRICLARSEHGELFAIDDTCTHEEESLSEGWVEGDLIECAAHNAVFDLRTGEAVALPAEDPVATHAVTVDGDDILLTVAPTDPDQR